MIDDPLRPATPADADGVSAVLAASYGTLFPAHHPSELLDRLLPLICSANEKLLASGTYYVVTAANGRVIACGGWSAGPPAAPGVDPSAPHIRHVAVHPDHLRRGLAGRIVRRCFDDAGPDVAFECFSSLAAESFYRAMGFDVLEPVEVPIRPDLLLPSLLMRREPR